MAMGLSLGRGVGEMRLRAPQLGLTTCFRLALTSGALLGLAACDVDDASSPTACSPTNIALTATKDSDRVNAVTSHVDEAMNALMGTVGNGSCSVVLVAGNTIKTINGYGDPRPPESTDSIPVTWPAQAPYYVGSIAKTVTALAMLRMIEESPDLGLDDTLGEHLADYDIPSGWSALTLRQLLSHTSGIAKDPTSIDSEASLQATFPEAGDHPGIHPRYAFESYKRFMPPGLGFNQQFTALYSNIGYSLLGLIIDDRVAGELAADASGYEAYVFDNIALDAGGLNEPAMVSMCLGASWRADNIENLAAPRNAAGVGISVFQGNGWEGPSGGWTMTVGDLGRLMIAMEYNERISPTMREEMLTREGRDSGTQMSSETGDEVAQYALGVAVEPSGAEPYFAKGGDIDGYTSNFKYYTSANVGAGILCSRQSVSHEALLDAIHAILEPCLGEGLNKPAFCSPTGGLAGG
ncbi:MAG: serine hydrolase domain-containing protein [Pseudomonadota bacterium]